MQPKYQLVAGTLREEIRSGRYRDTMLLPTEYELCSQFHMSRQTVRQALSLLASEGLIERRQGSGSHILATHGPAATPRRTVAVVTTYISNYIFPNILREIETVLAANNGAPTLFATQNQIGNERRILQTLLERRGQTVPREELMRRLWETDSFVDENTLNVNVTRLRKRLESVGLKDYISTQKGVGYRVD